MISYSAFCCAFPLYFYILLFTGFQNHVYDRVSTGEKPEAIEMDSGGRSNNESRPRRAPPKMDVLLRDVPEAKLEKYGFYAFFILFVLFNFIYWPWLLISADYFNWHIDYTYNVKEE